MMLLRVSGVRSLLLLWGLTVANRWRTPVALLHRIGEYGRGNFCFCLLLDQVSIRFGTVVLVVVSLVYLYRLGYMGGDKVRRKFFILLSLFVGRMVLLIFSGDLLRMFLAWEGLGVRSFLLVVYYNNHARASSGIITLISNRLGDVCFLLGLGAMMGFGEFTFLCSDLGGSVIFFFACVSKRAQWPLCGWLPAAMAAPTPVSALVHSSTLVTAGAYLLFRFEGVELMVMRWVVVVPLVTMFLARVRALVSYDLKRMVAMSTLSHISIISWAVLSGYGGFAFFHLLRHALFKSLLFLCAGAMIQEVGHSQDVRVIGGVFLSNPIFGIGLFYSRLNMAGVPLLSGYDSKEVIMRGVLLRRVQEGELRLVFGGLAMLFRGAYAFRLLFMLGGSCYGGVVCRSRRLRVVAGVPVMVLTVLSFLVGK